VKRFLAAVAAEVARELAHYLDRKAAA